jgi:hypothetical protein
MYAGANLWLAIASIVLASVLALPTLTTAAKNTSSVVQESSQDQAAQEQDALKQPDQKQPTQEAQRVSLWQQWVIGLLALSLGLVSAVQTKFASATAAADHHAAARQYRELYWDITRAIDFPEEDWEEQKKVVEELDTRRSKIEEDSPDSPKRFEKLLDDSR